MRPKKKTNNSIDSLHLVPQIYDQRENKTVTKDHLLALERSTPKAQGDKNLKTSFADLNIHK